MNRSKRQKGFALVLVLGIMLLLTILAAGIAFTVRSELNIAAGFSERLQARYLAHAGFQRALTELALDNPGVDSPVEGWSELRSDEEGWSFDNGQFVVRMSDESGKLNLNTADRDTLVAFFTQLTGDSAQAEEIADAILDWRDEDEEPQLMGAESDYYLTLEQPYRAKNAPFDSPYELLLVRGITRDLFYGSAELGIPPLTELVTTYSATLNVDERGLPRVNINTATQEQLVEALGDILTEQEINAILRFRDGQQQQRPSTQPPTGQQPPTGGQTGGSIPPGVRPPTGQPRPNQPGFPMTGGQRPQQPPTGIQRPQPSSPPGGMQRPQQSPASGMQSLPAAPSLGAQRPAQGRPSRGVPAGAGGEFPQTGGMPNIGQLPSGTQGQRPTSGSPPSTGGQRPTGGQAGQQRRQIRSLLDLRRVLPTEKLIAVWERLTTTDQTVLYGLINLNTAPPEVLAALLPENPAAVEEILAYREQNGGFQSVGELLLIGSLTQSERQQLVNRVCVKSASFRIRAAGIVGNQRAIQLIDAIVERQLVFASSDDTSSIATDGAPTVQFVVRAWRER